MNTGERDPLDKLEQIVKGVPATHVELNVLQGLGKTLLKRDAGSWLQQCGYCLEDTGSAVRFSAYEELDDETADVSLSVALYNETEADTSFLVTFQPNRRLDFEGCDDEELQRAAKIASDLLASEVLDPRATFVVNHLQGIISMLSGDTQPSEVTDTVRTAVRDTTAMAEILAWELIDAKASGKVLLKEFGYRWDNGDEIDVNSHELVGLERGDLSDDSAIPRLEIIFDTGDFIYQYTLGQDGSQDLEVLGMYNEFGLVEQDAEEDLSPLVQSFRKQLAMDEYPPIADDVRLLSSKLHALLLEDKA